MAFNFSTKHLSSQQQNIIRARKGNDERLKKQSNTTKDNVYEIAIMMKLGNDTEVKLQKYNQLNTKDFIIATTNKDLKTTIENSQYHFGYIQKK